MNFVKRAISSVLCIIFIMSVATPTTCAAEPRYIDLHSALCDIIIENDVAECYVAVISTTSNFHYKVTMRLYQDDNDYREWSYTGTSVINRTETCYVEPGHEYFVGIHIKVYDSAGNLIEQAINYSGVVEY